MCISFELRTPSGPFLCLTCLLFTLCVLYTEPVRGCHERIWQLLVQKVDRAGVRLQHTYPHLCACAVVWVLKRGVTDQWRRQAGGDCGREQDTETGQPDMPAARLPTECLTGLAQHLAVLSAARRRHPNAAF